MTAELLGYRSETAGRLMTTEYIAFKENQTAAVALEIARRARDTETIYSLYVTDAERRLTGILSLRRSGHSRPLARIGDVMTARCSASAPIPIRRRWRARFSVTTSWPFPWWIWNSGCGHCHGGRRDRRDRAGGHP